MAPAPTSEFLPRELSGGAGDGLEVALLRGSDADRVQVSVVDLRMNESIQLPVAPADAIHAFDHPFAYAAQLGLLGAPAVPARACGAPLAAAEETP